MKCVVASVLAATVIVMWSASRVGADGGGDQKVRPYSVDLSGSARSTADLIADSRHCADVQIGSDVSGGIVLTHVDQAFYVCMSELGWWIGFDPGQAELLHRTVYPTPEAGA